MSIRGVGKGDVGRMFTRGSSARFAWFAGFVFVVASGCYGTPRTSFPGEGGGAGGATGAGGIGGMNAGGTTGAGGIGGVSAGGAGGCSASLETDPKNCGACGHDCLGGKCEGAICRPFSVAEIPREYTRAIGLSPDYVLVSGSGYQNGAA